LETSSELGLGVIELVRADPQIGHYLGREIVRDRVVEECTDHGLHIEVEHTVRQRGTHVVADGAVEGGIAGGDHQPAVGQRVVADPPVENQRISGDLQPLVGRGQLVEEQYPLGLLWAGQELRWEPDRLLLAVVCIDRTADIDRFDRGQAQVDQGHATVRGNLVHDRRFAHTAGAPEHRCPPSQRAVRILCDQGLLGGADRHRWNIHRVA
jgi:hypothetical protein